MGVYSRHTRVLRTTYWVVVFAQNEFTQNVFAQNVFAQNVFAQNVFAQMVGNRLKLLKQKCSFM